MIENLPPRSFFNADDLSLLIAEHPDAPQFLAVKIADAHDAALAALVAERDALAAEVARMREALSSAIGYMMNARIDLETGCTKATAIKTISGGIERARAALTQGGEKP